MRGDTTQSGQPVLGVNLSTGTRPRKLASYHALPPSFVVASAQLIYNWPGHENAPFFRHTQTQAALQLGRGYAAHDSLP